jgi:hypothetical protein
VSFPRNKLQDMRKRRVTIRLFLARKTPPSGAIVIHLWAPMQFRHTTSEHIDGAAGVRGFRPKTRQRQREKMTESQLKCSIKQF